MNRAHNTHSIVLGIATALFLSAAGGEALSATTAKSSSKPNVEHRTAEPKPTKEQLAAKKAASSLTTTQRSKMLALINDGSLDELTEIHGIGKTRAEAVAKARPFKSVDQLADVKGVGEAVYADLIDHAKSLTARRSSSSTSKKTSSKSASSKRS